MTVFVRFLLFFAVCIVVSNPAAAQRSIDGLERAWKECQAKVNASPEFLALKHKIGSRALPTMASSTETATPEEARLLQVLFRDNVMTCRRFPLELARRRLPPIVPFLEAAHAKFDANVEQLVAGRMTWGHFIRDDQTINAELDDAIRRHECLAVDDLLLSDLPKK